jgi:transcriptional regulator with XRE-family HTH domain
MNEEFGAWLKEQRTFFGYKQNELADELGVARETIISWEAGLTAPRKVNMDKILNLFEMTREKLKLEFIRKRKMAKTTHNHLRTRSALNARESKNLPPRIIGGLSVSDDGFVGRKPLLANLHSFLETDQSGVFTLQGLGGCGKSATLAKFLSDLGVFSHNSPSADIKATFVWAFYENTDIETLFAILIDYLAPLFARGVSQAPNTDQFLSPLLLGEMLAKSHAKVLIVFDGLERVQDNTGQVSPLHGPVRNPVLKSFLQNVAGGKCGRTKVIITSRLLAPEISNERSDFAIEADLNQLESPDATELLTSRGVRSSQEELNRTAREFRFHAYSLRLLGDVLVKEFRGDARRRDRIIGPGMSARGDMAQILKWHTEHLPDESLLALQAMSVFREPIATNQIHELIPLFGKLNGPTSFILSRHRLGQALIELSGMGLIFTGESISAEIQFFDLHPIVRDYYYATLLDPNLAHKKAWNILQAPFPGFEPTEANEVNRLIEVIFHGVRSGQIEEAFEIYRQRMGGYTEIGTKRGDHSVGSKTIYTLLDRHATSADSDLLYRLYLDGGLFLKNEGRLEDAIDLLQTGLVRPEIAEKVGFSRERATMHLNVSGVEVLRGWVVDAEASAKKARIEFDAEAGKPDDEQWRRMDKECDSRLAVALGIRGDSEAIAIYNRIKDIPDSRDRPPREYDSIRHAWLLNNLGETYAVNQLLKSRLPFAEDVSAMMIVYRMKAQMAIAAIRDGNQKVASSLINEIAQWATRTDFHMFVQSWLLQSMFELQFGKAGKAVTLADSGAKHAGENGFTLEWMDVCNVQAQASLEQDPGRSLQLADKVLYGDSESYSYVLLGACNPSVQYVWAEATARYIQAKALRQLGREETAKKYGLEALDIMKRVGHYQFSELEHFLGT